jgi:hypothetical protein
VNVKWPLPAEVDGPVEDPRGDAAVEEVDELLDGGELVEGGELVGGVLVAGVLVAGVVVASELLGGGLLLDGADDEVAGGLDVGAPLSRMTFCFPVPEPKSYTLLY